jgi:hypothetical protein
MEGVSKLKRSRRSESGPSLTPGVPLFYLKVTWDVYSQDHHQCSIPNRWERVRASDSTWIGSPAPSWSTCPHSF